MKEMIVCVSSYETILIQPMNGASNLEGWGNGKQNPALLLVIGKQGCNQVVGIFCGHPCGGHQCNVVMPLLKKILSGNLHHQGGGLVILGNARDRDRHVSKEIGLDNLKEGSLAF